MQTTDVGTSLQLHMSIQTTSSYYIFQLRQARNDHIKKRQPKPADRLNLSLQLMEASFQKTVCADRQRNTTSDNCHSTIFLFAFQHQSPGHKLFLAVWSHTIAYWHMPVQIYTRKSLWLEPELLWINLPLYLNHRKPKPYSSCLWEENNIHLDLVAFVICIVPCRLTMKNSHLIILQIKSQGLH